MNLLYLNRSCLACAVSLLILTLASCDLPPVSPGNGNYPPVTSAMLADKTTSQRTGRDSFQFALSFQTSTFDLQGPSIPTDLLDALLGEGRSASHISGTWKILNGHIHFTINQVEGDQPLESEPILPIINTGVIRIVTPYAQYVF